MMTRKHFEAFARIIKFQLDTVADIEGAAGFDDGFYTGEAQAAENIANHMADLFAQENPNFDRQRFLTACGL